MTQCKVCDTPLSTRAERFHNFARKADGYPENICPPCFKWQKETSIDRLCTKKIRLPGGFSIGVKRRYRENDPQ